MTRGVALALALALAPASILAVNAATGRWSMTPEQRERLEDGKLAGIKAALKFTPEQDKLWAPVEAELRAQFKARADRRAEWQKMREARRADRAKGDEEASAAMTPERANMAERFERMSQRMTARAERMKAFSTAFSPFYAALNDDQKAVLGPAMRDLRLTGGRSPRGGGHWGNARGERWGGGPHDAGSRGTDGADHE